MGSDESAFNVLLIMKDKVTRQCPQTTIFEEKGESKRIRTEVPLLTLPLSQTDSLERLIDVHLFDAHKTILLLSLGMLLLIKLFQPTVHLSFHPPITEFIISGSRLASHLSNQQN